jgi:hypothetical protein
MGVQGKVVFWEGGRFDVVREVEVELRRVGARCGGVARALFRGLTRLGGRAGAEVHALSQLLRIGDADGNFLRETKFSSDRFFRSHAGI